MNTIKGFALNRSFINNAPGVVADIGELSTVGYTFSKEPREYSQQTYPTISLIHFPTDGSGVGTTASIPDAQVAHILLVINTIYTKSLSNTAVLAPGDFVDYLISQMGSAVANVTVGGQVVSGNRSIVEWIQWNNPAVDDTNINKVWFTNTAFVGQFDQESITVVPPFMPLDQFFGQPQDVKNLLTSIKYADSMAAIQAARGSSNETELWGGTYNYVNPVNKSDLTPVNFACLLYGEAANNIDLIKEAIVDYLLANSSYTRDQWKNILPDLFLRTEFQIYPQYSPMAVENVVGGTNGIYSPILTLTDAVNQIVADASNYDPTHVQTYAQVIPFPFMSIIATSIGNVENRDGKMKLSDWFPDYFDVNNMSADFNRMNLDTQGWSLMIAEMLPIARDMTSGSTVPIGYSRVVRGTKMFLAKSYENVQYLVAAPGNVATNGS